MADALSRLLRNQAERERLGRIAHARAIEHFTEEQFLRSYHRTYEALLTCPPEDLRSRLAVRE